MIEHSKGPLYGKLSICLDILGNFANIHTEWSSVKNSGWSPAYSVSSLMLNLQVVLDECSRNLAHNEESRRNVANECTRTSSHLDMSIMEPSLDTEIKVSDSSICQPSIKDIPQDMPDWDKSRMLQRFLSSNIDILKQRIDSEVSIKDCVNSYAMISDQLGSMLCWNYAPKEYIECCQLIFLAAGWQLNSRSCTNESAISIRNLVNSLSEIKSRLCGAEEPSKEKDPYALPKVTVDPEMICWFSQEHYNESILGIGIQRTINGIHTNITTDGALISIGAFTSGLRQTPMKERFEWFLPVFLCPSHSIDGPRATEWKNETINRVSIIGAELVPKGGGLSDYVVRIFPDLMNILIVRMMQPESDIRASERTFRVLIDIWRTFVWFADEYPSIKNRIATTLSLFVSEPERRTKANSPNIGWLLAMRSILPNEAVPFGSFLNAYVDENFLRSVMWWKKKGVSSSPQSVFEATQVSRHLLLFQSLFCHTVIGITEKELRHTAALADVTECKLLDRCESMLTKWKQLLSKEKNCDSSHPPSKRWADYFTDCGIAVPYHNVSAWIQEQVRIASMKEGYYFKDSGSRGSGRGRGRGNHGRGGKYLR